MVASIVVDGLVLPLRVGGHPALDFCNTRAGWAEPTPKEYLHTYPHLALWAREAGLTPTAHRAAPAAGAAVLTRALALRDALYDLLVGAAGPAGWAVLNSELARAGAASQLRPGHPLPTWELADTSAAAPLLAIAWSAGQLLSSVPTTAVHACPGCGCGWLFHDPRGRRRWCSMAWCGNRAKARRHADRSRAG